MSNAYLHERLESILEALKRIPPRFSSINSPTDFIANDEGREHLDSICMVLLSVGEAFRQIDQKTDGAFLDQYTEIPWRAVIGMRNVLAHEYFSLNEKVIYETCKESVPQLIKVVTKMVENT